MGRFIKRSKKSAGLPPGSLVHIGEKKTEKVKITLIDYDENNFFEKEPETIEECFRYKDKKSVTWINIDGLHDVGLVEKIGQQFNLHPLVLEDILNTGQRPKTEDLDDYFFVVLKMLTYNEKEKMIESEQVSLVFSKNFVISFQEKPGDVFESIRNRIRNGKGRIRKMKADYLSYVLIDAIVDNYFSILEKIGDRVEDLEEELLQDPSTETMQRIHSLKREMLFLRKSVWPFREAINGLVRSESKIIQKTTMVYLKDVYDHTIQVIDTAETFRDMISGMLDVYLSTVSNKMNEVMKVLTIFAAIFIPLTFVAGVYGMNFQNMPELGWNLGYPMALMIMLLVGLVMLFYFKRKKWL
jgi:magnesium transporter